VQCYILPLLTGVLFYTLELSTAASAQNMVQIPFSSTAYHSLNGSSSVANPGYAWWLGLPDSNVGTMVTYCPIGGFLYTWAAWGPFSASQPTNVWAGICNTNCSTQCNCPLGENCCSSATCPVIYPAAYPFAVPGAVYISNNLLHVVGLGFDGVFQGVIDTSSDPSVHTTQAVYYSQRSCYDAGPEFGFYRRLPTDSNIHFYFGEDVNCSSHVSGPVLCPSGTCMHAGGTCTDKGGMEVDNEIHDYQLIASTGCSGSTEYLYTAWLEDTTGMGCTDGKCGFLVQIADSCGNTIYNNILYINASSRFVNDAELMLRGQLPGYINIAAQKNVHVTASGSWFGTMTSSSLGMGVDNLYYYTRDQCHAQQHGLLHVVCKPDTTIPLPAGR